MQRFSWVLVLFALIVAGCGGGGGSSSAVGPGSQNAGTATGTMTLAIPARVANAAARNATFISPSVTSVKISMAGLADQIFSLTTNSSACTTTPTAGRVCTIAFNAVPGTPTITVTLYDGTNASANVLGTGSATATVTAGQPFTVSVTINAAVSTVTIALSSGFSSGFPGTATVSAVAHDADGNTITGPGNFAVPLTLQLTDTSGSLSLSGTTLAGPTSTVTLTYNGGSPSVSNPAIQGSVAQSGVQVNAVQIFNSGQPTTCGSPLPLPGTYTTIFSVGTVSGTTYTANVSGATPPAEWSKVPYTQGTPSPAPTATAPSPTPSPSTSPTPGQPVYVYIGTYALTTTSGCFFAITSQDGSPIANLTGIYAGSSGFADGLPNLPANANGNFLSATFGNITSMVINNLSSTGGSGTVALSNGDMGTITLTARFATTEDKARRLGEQQLRR